MNNRRHYRVYFNQPLKATLSVSRIINNPISSKSTTIYILDISASGLRFTSSLRFPATDKLIMTIRFHLSNHKFSIMGTIVRKRPLLPNNYEYGFMFSTDEAFLYNVINQLSFKII